MDDLIYTICPLGDSAILIDYGNRFDGSISDRVLSAATIINAARIVGVKDIVPAYSSITVHYNLCEVIIQYKTQNAFEVIKEYLEGLLNNQHQQIPIQNRVVKIPVCYDKVFAPDIENIARLTKLAVDEVIQIHQAQVYKVFMIGFLPGFPYMGFVDERIAVSRRNEPRTRVEPGSVGIAGRQTGIYPLASPGGWQIIGKTPLKLFDKSRPEPVLLQGGDGVQFFSISLDEFNDY